MRMAMFLGRAIVFGASFAGDKRRVQFGDDERFLRNGRDLCDLPFREHGDRLLPGLPDDVFEALLLLGGQCEFLGPTQQDAGTVPIDGRPLSEFPETNRLRIILKDGGKRSL